jgi:uncharacterized integral membrane protein
MVKLKVSLAVVLVLLVLIVVFQNREPVETKFLFASITMPRAALLTVTMLIGIAVDMLLSLGFSKKTSRKS